MSDDAKESQTEVRCKSGEKTLKVRRLIWHFHCMSWSPTLLLKFYKRSVKVRAFVIEKSVKWAQFSEWCVWTSSQMEMWGILVSFKSLRNVVNRVRNWKKFQVAYWRLLKKNGRQMQKLKLPESIEQKLRSEPHLIDLVVRLLELNPWRKHPPVTAAWDSRSEQTFLKGFETLLVHILTTILLPGYF